MSSATDTADIRAVKAIDVHGHYGTWSSIGGVLHQLGNANAENPIYNNCMSADAATVARRALAANIEWTIVSPLLGLVPRGKADTVLGNREAFDVVPRTPGLRQWVIVNPRQPETYAQAADMLQAPWCVGIKIHPEENVYPIREYGREIFEFAAKHRAVVLTHSGGVNSVPEEFVPFANALPELRLILAHLGHMDVGDITHQVRAIQACRHGNVYVDTSSGKSVISGLVEWAVGEIGSDRILFGSDTCLYHPGMYRGRIDHADLPLADREKILAGNARRLLGL
ncbi:MAG: amidohydrolase family protein [Opitutaceae bacterium]|nr:amidohydrolase family protein [Opitutaceae bacterium]